MTDPAAMTDDELDQIEARCNAATSPNTWGGDSWTWVQDDDGKWWVTIEGVGSYPIAQGIDREVDATFIAAARSDIPRLVAELRRLRAENAELKAKILRHIHEHR